MVPSLYNILALILFFFLISIIAQIILEVIKSFPFLWSYFKVILIRKLFKDRGFEKEEVSDDKPWTKYPKWQLTLRFEVMKESLNKIEQNYFIKMYGRIIKIVLFFISYTFAVLYHWNVFDILSRIEAKTLFDFTKDIDFFGAKFGIPITALFISFGAPYWDKIVTKLENVHDTAKKIK